MNTLPALLLAAAGVGLGHAVMPDHWLPLAVLARTRRYPTRRVVRLSLAAGLSHVLVSVLLGGILMLVGMQFRTAVAHHTDLVVGGLLLATGLVFLVLELLGRGHGHSHDDGHGHSHRGHGHEHGHSHHGNSHGSSHGHHHAHDVDHGHDHDHPHGEHRHEHGHEHGHEHSATALLDRPPAPAAAEEGRGRRLAGLLIPFGAAASPDLTILPVFLAAGALGATAALGSLAVFTVATIGAIVGLTTATALGARLLTAPWIDRRANLITALTLIGIGALVATGTV
ncbi:hypothetical protein [Streptacidiphilus melanogenes]|uniref:hypothetical protein n=1 Tax=Streptacidiphilus melanogenes TaxID=411235 RepID=UPI000AB71951|nr:hypothetical protein [Streptacidiphilus melanogenes]